MPAVVGVVVNTISRRSHSVAGRLVQARAVPVLIRLARAGSAGGPLSVVERLVQGRCQSGWPTHNQQAVPFCGRTAGPGLVAIGKYGMARAGKTICGRLGSVSRVLISANLI